MVGTHRRGVRPPLPGPYQTGAPARLLPSASNKPTLTFPAFPFRTAHQRRILDPAHEPRCTVGLDFGTRSVRALVVDTANGREWGTATWNYAHGDQGVILSDDPHLARQHPPITSKASNSPFVAPWPTPVVTTATSIPPGSKASVSIPPEAPLCPWMNAADPWLSSVVLPETPRPWPGFGRITLPQPKPLRSPIAPAGNDPSTSPNAEGTYSSEWFFSKILHCRRTAPEVFAAAHRWVECADWIPATLTGTEAPDRLTIGICAAGHKGMYHTAWGGYPRCQLPGRP
jgi:L-ribulokinase